MFVDGLSNKSSCHPVLVLVAIEISTTVIRSSFPTGRAQIVKNLSACRRRNIYKRTKAINIIDNTMRLPFALLFVATAVKAFVPTSVTHQSSFGPLKARATVEEVPPTPKNNVKIYPDAKSVSDAVRRLVSYSAKKSISERGHFALAIPGGSILKMLVGDDILDGVWTSKTTIAYVNHKCVPMDDLALATHAKAKKLFLEDWLGCTVITMDGTSNAKSEAANYEAKLKALPLDVLPRNEYSGLPVFDLALIGVGDDGHIGSLYPGRDEVLEETAWVLPVEMKYPPSITLTLPIMASARQVVVAACGVSEKYPQGKSDGMRRAVASPTETIKTFPAVGLRPKATWIMDEAAASKLGDTYK